MANSELVLAERCAGAWNLRAKLVWVKKGSATARIHGREFRDTGRIAFKDEVRVFEPVD